MLEISSEKLAQLNLDDVREAAKLWMTMQVAKMMDISHSLDITAAIPGTNAFVCGIQDADIQFGTDEGLSVLISMVPEVGTEAFGWLYLT